MVRVTTSCLSRRKLGGRTKRDKMWKILLEKVLGRFFNKKELLRDSREGDQVRSGKSQRSLGRLAGTTGLKWLIWAWVGRKEVRPARG
jgi:hypothetical protein